MEEFDKSLTEVAKVCSTSTGDVLACLEAMEELSAIQLRNGGRHLINLDVYQALLDRFNDEESPDELEEGWRVGKIKFYDTEKSFGFVRDLTVPNYMENEDDVYLGADVQVGHELVDGVYVVFRKVPSSRKPGTYKADEVRLLRDYPGEVDSLITTIPSEDERDRLRRYLSSEQARWQIGRVKFFDSEKGFGFIQPLKQLDVLNDDDAYVNQRDVATESLSDGAHVVFRIVPSGRKPGEYKAAAVQQLEKFDQDPTYFKQYLISWSFGDANLSPDASALSHLVPRSQVDEVLGVIELAGREIEKRAESQEGETIRLIEEVINKAIENERIPAKWSQRIWEKYGREVRRLVNQGYLPERVEWSLWLDGTLEELPPEELDALVDRAFEQQASEETRNTPLSSVSSRQRMPSSSKYRTQRRFKLRDVIQRFSEEDLAGWISRHTETLSEAAQEATEPVQLVNRHQSLLEQIRTEHDEGNAEQIDAYANAIGRLARRCYENEGFTAQQSFSLWKDGLLDEVSYSEFFTGFIDSQNRKQRIDALSKLEPSRRREFALRRTARLFDSHTSSEGGELSELKRWLNDVRGYSDQRGTGSEETTGESLSDQCESVLLERAKERAQVTLFGEGLLSSFPEDWLRSHIGEVSREDLENVLKRTDQEVTQEILTERLDLLADMSEEPEDEREENALPFRSNWITSSKGYQEAKWLLSTAEQELGTEANADIQTALSQCVGAPIHVQLYQDEHLAVDPQSAIVEYLNYLTAETIDIAESWVDEGVLDESTLSDALRDYLDSVQVTDREDARCVQAAVRQLDEYAFGQYTPPDVSSKTGHIVRLTRWVDQNRSEAEEGPFDFSLLEKGLRWISPEDQVTALRKAFYLHSKDVATLTPEKLGRCSAFHLDEREGEAGTATSAGDTAPPLRLSAELIIQTIQHVAEVGEFPREGYLIQIVQHVTRDDPSRRIQLLDIFNQCEGRAELKMGASYGEVKEVKDRGRRKFVISFPYSEEIVKEVRRLPGRKYNPDEKVWTVPANNEKQRRATFKFAHQNSFFIDLLDGKHWTNNDHLAKKEREERPTGVTYCEGRKAKRQDYGAYDFWWCRNEKCYSNCHGQHQEDEWEAFTLENFLVLLDLHVEEDLPRDTIEMGQYHRFLGWVNRFKQLLNRLYCRECGHILSSSRSTNYAHYRVTHFKCSNASCSKHNQEIYLHHCLNGKCGSVIDSRDSEQCPNGWWICTNPECGACCSHEEMVRRRDRLREVGEYVPQGLIQDIKEKVGHLERAEHFCNTCGVKMEETKEEYFRCPNGHVEYDLSETNFDRPHRSLEEG